MNPILSAMSSNSSNNLKELYQMFCSFNNPTQAFMMMANNNPNLKPCMELLKCGNNPEQVARELMRQRGINPDEFIKSLVNLKG